MITKFYPKSAFLKNCTLDTILVSRFNMLFQYAENSFSREFYRWPAFKVLAKKKLLKNNSIKIFLSKFGMLILFNIKLPEFGNKKQIKKYNASFHRLFNKIVSSKEKKFEDDFVLRIDISSFCQISSEDRKRKFLQFILSSPIKFEVYF